MLIVNLQSFATFLTSSLLGIARSSGVFLTPAVVNNGVVKCVGRVPKQSEVEEWLD